VLAATTLEAWRKQVYNILTSFVLEAAPPESPLVKGAGPITLALSTQPRSLLLGLRRRATIDPLLKGVRVDGARFDEHNILVLSGCQDHEGQAELLVGVARIFATELWQDRPLNGGIQAGQFKTVPLQPLLLHVGQRLPNYPEATGVNLTAISYGADSSLRFAGRATLDTITKARLEEIIRSILGLDGRVVIGLDLLPEQRSSSRSGRAPSRRGN
jgi:hypothetical protein